jgi:hypothetical protein
VFGRARASRSNKAGASKQSTVSRFVIPTHNRAEGRAPVWGSEFYTKAATPQGDSADFAAG